MTRCSKWARRLAQGLCGVGFFGIAASAAAAEPNEPAEIVTWWHSPTQQTALAEMIKSFEATGFRWKTIDITGDMNAQTFVSAAIIANHPPAAAQWIDGTLLDRLMRDDMLRTLNVPAWNAVLPPIIQEKLTAAGGYIAAPVSIRGRNWLWLNLNVFKQAGITVPSGWPRSWAELNATALQLQQAGFVPLVVGHEPWEQFLVLDDIVAGMGGLDFYQRALIDFDEDALSSPIMLASFDELYHLMPFMKVELPYDADDEAGRAVISGRAAMYMTGDWQKAGFEEAGMSLGRDFDCVPTPGSADFSLINVEMFVFPKTTDPAISEMQTALAKVTMDPNVQRDFNRIKGTTPVRLDIADTGFDKCSRWVMAHMHEGNRLSFGAHRSMSGPVAEAVSAAISTFISHKLTPEEGVTLLRRTVAANR
jgi:glucose/mannose transport system substrate-binding protein